MAALMRTSLARLLSGRSRVRVALGAPTHRLPSALSPAHIVTGSESTLTRSLNQAGRDAAGVSPSAWARTVRAGGREVGHPPDGGHQWPDDAGHGGSTSPTEEARKSRVGGTAPAGP